MPGKKKTHMPALHERIHDHLVRKGFSDSHAWATAVNAVRKGCETGDTNFPGKQEMGKISRTRYCNAYKQWLKSHPGAAKST